MNDFVRNPGMDFATRIVTWQRAHGRHDLPWQGRGAYAVWVSEIMLQQTQVETVIPYYRRFLARFPDLASLAKAGVDEVLALWSGLGYYARARNLHAAAVRAHAQYGHFPASFEAMLALPGIGRSTAGAIVALTEGDDARDDRRRPILDGNVRRVLCRAFGIDGWPGDAAVQTRLWALAGNLLPPASHIRPYTQGLMDLGATLCTRGRPRCGECPLGETCVAARTGRQAELPYPRPKKALPERRTDMLILSHASHVLLEQRPPSGIWGGLWSLPEAAPETPRQELESRFGTRLDELSPAKPVVHGFSHFRLHICPRRFAVRHPPARLEEAGRLWLPLCDLAGAALPAPVRNLLAEEETPLHTSY